METFQPGKLRPEIADPKPAGYAERLGVEALTFPQTFRSKIGEWKKPIIYSTAGAGLMVALLVGMIHWQDIEVALIQNSSAQISKADARPTLGLPPLPTFTATPPGSGIGDYHHITISDQGENYALTNGAVFFNIVPGITLDIFDNRIDNILHNPEFGIDAPRNFAGIIYFGDIFGDDPDFKAKLDQKWSSDRDRVRGLYLDRFGQSKPYIAQIAWRTVIRDYFANTDSGYRSNLPIFQAALSANVSYSVIDALAQSVVSYAGGTKPDSSKINQAIKQGLPVQISSIDQSVFRRSGFTD